MKLLFDENLSPKLARLLEDICPNSTHVRNVGLNAADDPLVWDYAKEHAFILVSKDADMHQRSFVFGAPPKCCGFVWVIVRRQMLKNYSERTWLRSQNSTKMIRRRF